MMTRAGSAALAADVTAQCLLKDADDTDSDDDDNNDDDGDDSKSADAADGGAGGSSEATSMDVEGGAGGKTGSGVRLLRLFHIPEPNRHVHVHI